MNSTTITVVNPFTQQSVLVINQPAQPEEKSYRAFNKKKGVSSEVYPFTLGEAHDVLGFFKDHKMWQHYLLFVLGFNTARRAGDLLALTWENIVSPATGKVREDMEIVEEKTQKIAKVRLNDACRSAIDLYIEENRANPADNEYKNLVFIQSAGTHKGNCLTYDGYRKGIKRAAEAVGIEKNVGTHSARKSFGMTNRRIHYADQDNMEILRSILNHSDTKTTSRYIGLTRERMNQYYDDIGEAFTDYVTGDKEYKEEDHNPIVALDVNDLRDILNAAYGAGLENSGNNDPKAHLEAMANLMQLVDRARK